jgi:hypothetical protein
MLNYDLRQCLPSSAELPDSDDTPVDNELQKIPDLLKRLGIYSIYIFFSDDVVFFMIS